MTVSTLNDGRVFKLQAQEYDSPRFGRLAEGDQGLYSGPTSTPEFDAASGLLFTLSCDGQGLLPIAPTKCPPSRCLHRQTARH